MNSTRLRELKEKLQKLIDDPGECNVDEYAELQMEYNNLLMQQEAEMNRNSKKNAERRRTMNQEYSVNLTNEK